MDDKNFYDFIDEDKRTYKEWRGIRYSDCYEVWDLSPTPATA